MSYLREFSDYVDSGQYLPGELARMNLTAYNPYDPQNVTETIAKSRFKFRPETSNTGKSFQDFFNIQMNPSALFNTATAPGMANFMQTANMFSQ